MQRHIHRRIKVWTSINKEGILYFQKHIFHPKLSKHGSMDVLRSHIVLTRPRQLNWWPCHSLFWWWWWQCGQGWKLWHEDNEEGPWGQWGKWWQWHWENTLKEWSKNLWPLRHWPYLWQLRTTIITFTVILQSRVTGGNISNSCNAMFLSLLSQLVLTWQMLTYEMWTQSPPAIEQLSFSSSKYPPIFPFSLTS